MEVHNPLRFHHDDLHHHLQSRFRQLNSSLTILDIQNKHRLSPLEILRFLRFLPIIPLPPLFPSRQTSRLDILVLPEKRSLRKRWIRHKASEDSASEIWASLTKTLRIKKQYLYDLTRLRKIRLIGPILSFYLSYLSWITKISSIVLSWFVLLLLLLFQSPPSVFYLLHRLKLWTHLPQLILLTSPRPLLLPLLALPLLLLHLVKMIHRTQSQILHPQISKRLNKLSKRKSSWCTRLWSLHRVINFSRFMHFRLQLGIVVIFIRWIWIELFLKLGRRQRRINQLNLLPVIWSNQVWLELHHSVENIIKTMSLHVIVVLHQIIRKQINLLRVSMNFLSHSYTPNQRIYPFIRIVPCQLRSVEMHLQQSIIRL